MVFQYWKPLNENHHQFYREKGKEGVKEGNKNKNSSKCCKYRSFNALRRKDRPDRGRVKWYSYFNIKSDLFEHFLSNSFRTIFGRFKESPCF